MRDGITGISTRLAEVLIVIIFHLLRDHQSYQEYGEQAVDERQEETRKRRAVRQLQMLGYQVPSQQAESAYSQPVSPFSGKLHDTVFEV